MKVVVDTNIAFSGILNTDGKIGDLLMNSFQIFEFYSCQYLRQELHIHHNKLLEISKLSSEELEASKFQILIVLSSFPKNKSDLLSGQKRLSSSEM